jgi:hypothetical protein
MENINLGFLINIYIKVLCFLISIYINFFYLFMRIINISKFLPLKNLYLIYSSHILQLGKKFIFDLFMKHFTIWYK